MSETKVREAREAPTAEAVLAVLRAHEAELRAAGVTRASIFGSVARGDATPESDVDVLLQFDETSKRQGLAHVGRLMDLQERLATLLGHPVDIASEPMRRASFRERVERDRILAFQ